MGKQADVCSQCGERCAQFMRGVRNELPLGLERPFERREQRIELCRETADLVSPVLSGARAQVA